MDTYWIEIFERVLEIGPIGFDQVLARLKDELPDSSINEAMTEASTHDLLARLNCGADVEKPWKDTTGPGVGE